jgi:hypothetical protein
MTIINNGLISVTVRCGTENIQEKKMAASITQYNLDISRCVLNNYDRIDGFHLQKRQKDQSFREPCFIILMKFSYNIFSWQKNLLVRRTTNLAIITRPMLNLVASGLGLALISKTVHKIIMYNVTPSLHQNTYTTMRIAIYCNTLRQNGNILQYGFCCIVTPLYTVNILSMS